MKFIAENTIRKLRKMDKEKYFHSPVSDDVAPRYSKIIR